MCISLLKANHANKIAKRVFIRVSCAYIFSFIVYAGSYTLST